MDFTRCKIWKNDLKILASPIIKCVKHIKSFFAAKITQIVNSESNFPFYAKYQREPSPMPVPESKYVYYGEGAHNKNVVLLSYIKLPVDR